MQRMITFSERIQRRRRLWWGVGGRRSLHQMAELFAWRARDDADRRWRCCPYWPRTLANKWNARQFALRHGLAVPELYWVGRRPAALPLAALPADFVVRAVHGTRGARVLVVRDDHELLGDTPAARDALPAMLRARFGRLARWPLLVEECALDEGGGAGLPVEYKCYTFGATVGAIEVVCRTTRHTARIGHYTPHWEPFDAVLQTAHPPAPRLPPPRCLAEILHIAATLGAACGTFMRFDCFASTRGALFGEVSTTPHDGRRFTPAADALLGALWQRTIPDCI